MKCTECGQPCKVLTVDFGIGQYEYWGSVETDVQMRDVSHCCEAECCEDGEIHSPRTCRLREQMDEARDHHVSDVALADRAYELAGKHRCTALLQLTVGEIAEFFCDEADLTEFIKDHPLAKGDIVRTTSSCGEPSRRSRIDEIRVTKAGDVRYILEDGGWFHARELKRV